MGWMRYFYAKYLFYIDIFKSKHPPRRFKRDGEFSVCDDLAFSINKVIHRFDSGLKSTKKSKTYLLFQIYYRDLKRNITLSMTYILQVLIHTPAHSNLPSPLSYTSDLPLPVGSIVKVPLGKREVLGVVHDQAQELMESSSSRSEIKFKNIISHVPGLDPLQAHWLNLVEFTASYYQRSLGEVAIAALPTQLKALTGEQIQKRLQKWQSKHEVAKKQSAPLDEDSKPVKSQTPSPEQEKAIQIIQHNEGPFLLFGSTGSGKTEVYLKCIETLLSNDPNAQVLIMVPEINLTPQLENRIRERFCLSVGLHAIATMHSELTPAQRLNAWLAAHQGHAKIILGTRMSIFASLPNLKLIVVDEEHDTSYKQQEGARYSARDLAVYRGALSKAKVILGSATPSLESWYHSLDEVPKASEDQVALPKRARYLRIEMPSRIGNASLPQLNRVDMNFQPKYTLFSPPLLQAIKQRIENSEQVLILLNRRGYSPVLYCTGCGWKSQCNQCSAFKVFHKADRTLRCHHCGDTQNVPKKCPLCSNQDITMLGMGTERLEETLLEALFDLSNKDKESIMLIRIDADSTKTKGSLEAQLDLVHSGEVDVLIGTQMIAKGHDFRRVTLVAALEVDSALYSNDFRSSERLFALLMQAAGRSGRDVKFNSTLPCELWIQTFNPKHPVFKYLKAHDYPGFANYQLLERQMANMPPFCSQALIKAESRSQENAQKFLNEIKALTDTIIASMINRGHLPSFEHIVVYSPIPMNMRKIANVERAQLLIESMSKKYLQSFLTELKALMQLKTRDFTTVRRWVIDIDPHTL